MKKTVTFCDVCSKDITNYSCSIVGINKLTYHVCSSCCTDIRKYLLSLSNRRGGMIN
jgi:hypothetical protein